MTSNLDPDHQKIAEIILGCVRQQMAGRDSSGTLHMLLVGSLEAAAEQILTSELLALGNRVRWVRAFRSEGERNLWCSRFSESLPDLPTVLLHFDRNVLAQGVTVGEFDLVFLVEADGRPDLTFELLPNLKRLLKRKGLLLLETKIERAPEWKDSLVQAGFDRVIARSERAGSRTELARELLLARSDGRIRVPVAAESPLPSESASGPERVDGRASDIAIRPALNREVVRERVISLLVQMLRLSPGDLDTSSPFTEFGVDSIAGVRFVNGLNEQFRIELKPTILFDYASVEKLANFIAEQCQPKLAETNSESQSPAEFPAEKITITRSESPVKSLSAPLNRETDVAVIGISGRFPGADNIDRFWSNLEAGKNSITEVPPERWDYRQFYQPDSRQANKTNSKWGGFLADVDKFDPLFFSISGRESEATDPQHRLFLEECYHALEDAGYAGPSATIAKKCGVFVGVEPGDYLHLLLDQSGRGENSPVFQGNAESILAARISYFLDLKGPSIAINTACSSSLVAIHLACQSLANGECDLVLAGGVRVLSSEKAYLALGNMGMLSADGQCKTFDDDANGFVPGEAVGVLVLKPLSAALQAGDHIYGLIKGSATNQDGRTNGITAPSSVSQTQVELEVYEKFGIHPETLQYVEAHGTGTKLGDPIEIEALTQSFRRFTARDGFCAVGSVKTNIGHTMAAAGVCSVIKVLLSLQHGKMVPSLNLRRTNPYIDFSRSPFFVSTTLRDWLPTPGRPRRAAISSFGFSGTNSHLVIEEPPPQTRAPSAGKKPAYLVTISAKTSEALELSQGRLMDWLSARTDRANLEDISFTLNVGRGHFEYRCAIVAGSVSELADALRGMTKGDQVSNGWRSTGRPGEGSDAVIFRQLVASLLKELRDPAYLGTTIYREKLAALAALYTKGYALDFELLHQGEAHRRISLPSYPFARERYWISNADDTAATESRRPGGQAQYLHPLVQRNVSTLTQIKFASSFDGAEFFLDQHQIRGTKTLPGVAYLEMAAATVREATESPQLALANLAWLRPLAVTESTEITINLSSEGADVRFEICSASGQLVHAKGKAVRGVALPSRRENLAAIRERCTRTESPASIYTRCAEAGLVLGPAFRTIREVWFAPDEALARLELPEDHASNDFMLHPGLMDGALQTTAILGRDRADGLPVPFALSRACFNRLETQCYAHVRRHTEENGLLRFDVSLLSDSGDLLLELQGLMMRALRPEPTASAQQPIYIRPVWNQKSLPPSDLNRLNGLLLLFDTKDDLVNQISRNAPNLRVLRIVPAENFSAQGSVIEVRPDRAENFDQLLDLGIPNFVIHRWPVLVDEINPPTQTSIVPLFHLTRGLIRRGVNAPVKLLLVHSPNAHPVYPAVAGYARTLRQERPNLHLRILETDGSEALKMAAELLDLDRELQVRYLDDRREVKRLEIFAPERKTAIPFREQGVYVITGGLGGLGRMFARHIAKQCRARLVLLGRSEPTSEHQAIFTELEQLGAQAAYFRVDVTTRRELNAAMDEVRSRWGQIHGVIHAAGVIRDDFLLNKSDEQFAAVLAPKVDGALLLDEATSRDPLDFFVLFASMTGLLGNVGQSDYAYANCFLDEFALWREAQRIAGRRNGRTVSVDWSLWRNGGMRQTRDIERIKLTEVGLTALEDDTGFTIFSMALQCHEPQLMGLTGDLDKVRSVIAWAEKPPLSSGGSASVTASIDRPIHPSTDLGNRRPSVSLAAPDHSPADAAGGSQNGITEFRASALRFLTEKFSAQVRIPAIRIRPEDPLEKYGIDSIMVMEFTQLLEQDFGELSKTLLFEHQTLAELTDYFIENHTDRLRELVSVTAPPTERFLPEARVTGGEVPAESEPSLVASPASPPKEADDIAIVGVFGRYPMADDLEQFWDNLRVGKDCIIEIPKERWDYRLFYNTDPSKREPGKPGMTSNKWGGFLNDVERFDAQFFNITPREAFAIDPQERLFLETVWRTVEDAGYRKSALANRKVGVFVGVMYGEYQLYGAGDIAEGWVYPLSSSYASIANRVSYFFNWHGPSMAIDSMCSSSLTSIHLACESVRRGESELAIAGGVNTSVHPHKDILLSPGGFAASDGRCRSFGEGGDGYVPGEGVGAVLLKPLAKAIADGDHVYAIVKASALNHDGKTNGYTVPNPKAQAELVLRALSQGGVAPDTINYIEAHGTGTALGDPIEITGLTKAFRESAPKLVLERHFCAVGSVKSNIGHLESAAGIAGVTKVLLQMRHGQLAPSLHSERLNPNINFSDSIFQVPQTLQTWEPVEVSGRRLRRAGISSFGAGGANAHLILEEFTQTRPRSDVPNGPVLIILSAKTEDRLRARAEQLLKYLQRSTGTQTHLIDVAYTLQVGREPLEERLAFVANDRVEACQNLRQFLAGESGSELLRGTVRSDVADAQSLLVGDEGRAFLDTLVRQQKWQKLGQFWTSGGDVEWEQLPRDVHPFRVPLPTYPFSGQRYWAPERMIRPKKKDVEHRLHPLVHRNVSDFEGQAFLTRWEPDDLIGSKGNRAKRLPGLCLIEMGIVAARLSSRSSLSRAVNITWAAPCVATETLSLFTKVVADGSTVRFEVCSDRIDNPILAQGEALPGSFSPHRKEDLELIRQRCPERLAADIWNRQLVETGLFADPSSSPFSELWRGDHEGLMRFQRSALDQTRFGECDWHPLFLEAALVFARFLHSAEPSTPFVPVSLASGFLDKLPEQGWLHVTVRDAPGGKQTIEIAILQTDGSPVGELSGLTVRHFQPLESPEPVFLRPVWEDRSVPVVAAEKLSGRLLLLDESTELEKSIRAQYPSLSVTRVTPGARFSPGAEFFQVNPRSWGDYQRLLATVNPDFIVDRWASNSLPLPEALELGIFSLFRVVRALMQRNPESEIRLLFSYPLGTEPAYQAVGAFAKTLMQENPQLQLRVLQTDETDAGLLSEFFAGPDEREIRRSEGQRQIRAFEIFEPGSNRTVPLRKNGVYLITGGLGGLGLVLAEYLAKQHQARLVLNGRSALTDDGRARVAELESFGGQVLYVRADAARENDARELIRQTKERFGVLNGVIHAAGVLRDSFLIKKELTDFVDVLSPKVRGVVALDEATREENLDFFAIFSSTAGIFGNVGQSDYAYANAFLDAFASLRESRRLAGERQGKSISINWPLWKDGGMAVAGRNVEAQLARIGLYPLPRDAGIAFFEAALCATESQLAPLWGIRRKLVQTFLQGSNVTPDLETAGPVDAAALTRSLETYLQETLADVTQLPVSQVHSDQRFEELGVDSIVVGDFNLRLEQSLGPLPKTLLFEHANLRQLSKYLVTAFTPQVARFFGGSASTGLGRPSAIQTGWKKLESLPSSKPKPSASSAGEDIAIVGLAGRYPQANDLRAFWEILKSGRDCVTEIPKDRWDIDRYYDPDPNKAAEGKMYSRWGAFLDDVDKFDPLFFNIAPVEAELMDPQERLFLETAWIVLEDAGYTRQDLARWVRKEYATNVGVFVGVTTNTYSFVARDNIGDRAMSTLPWSLANRVSYLFNFNGPSIPVDTACSSSLTAIHLACEAIRHGECQQAIAGGVNLYLHPSKYVSLCLARMLSTDGKCRAFGEGGDGFVPGEGVGAVFLKPLSLALAHGDHVYAVIKGTSVNHGGRTNGYTVPNPGAQAELIVQALRGSGIEPQTLSYIEAHGTGTALGDPIEIAGLAKAFALSGDSEAAEGSCAIGSVKTNIGHLEAAAGIAGLTKVLLQMRHGQLAPSLHATEFNSNIVFDGTPFRVQRTLEEWRPARVAGKMWPRRAGISSFGAGGANAHVILEEFVGTGNRSSGTPPIQTPVLIVLSAKSSDRMRELARSLSQFLSGSSESEMPLAAIAYTLQVGREALEERVAFVCVNHVELISQLEEIGRGNVEKIIYGRVKRERAQLISESDSLVSDPAAFQAARQHDLERLGQLWVSGALINWEDLDLAAERGQRLSLPGYPFKRDRYWVPAVTKLRGAEESAHTFLHPLIHRNNSTLSAQCYESEFSGQEMILRDHRVAGETVLPGAATLELALVGSRLGLDGAPVRLRQLVWVRPVITRENGLKLRLRLLRASDGTVSFEVQDRDGRVHVQGNVEVAAGFPTEQLDVEAIRLRCSGTISPEELYAGFAARSLEYGPGFRVIQEIRYGNGEALTLTELPPGWSEQEYFLHPALLDGALQSLAMIGAGGDGVEVPFAVNEVECSEALPGRCYAYCRVEAKEGNLHRYTIKLLRDDGLVLAGLTGLSVRRIERSTRELSYFRPSWSREAVRDDFAINYPVLLFSESPELAAAWERQAAPMIRVLPGDGFGGHGNIITIRSESEEDYARLVQEVDFGSVIHHWSQPGAALKKALNCGLYSIHRLIRALLASGKQATLLYAYPAGEAAYEAVAGYAKSLRQEQTKLWIKTVGLEENAVDLLAELSDLQAEVRYRNGVREVRTLERLPATQAGAENPLKRGGVYLVSGGAGGLGRIVAEHLVQRYDARLLLVGRSELDDARSHDLARFDGNIVYVKADVSKPDEARFAVREAKRHFGVLNGVIHAAAALRDGLIRNKHLGDFEAVLAPKVFGAETLDAVTGEEALDCFILFSSTAALLGNAGQSDYAYANAYLDSFVHARERLRQAGQRSGRSLSINWPLWQDGGMKASEETLRFQLETLGLQPLDRNAGLMALTRALSLGENQCAVLCGTPEKLFRQIGSTPLNHRHESTSNGQMPAAKELRTPLLVDLKQLVAKVLRLDVAVLESDADTSEYGFDSITFTSLANELNAMLGLEITPAVLFEYRTLDSFADFLCHEFAAKLEQRYGPSTGVPTPSPTPVVSDTPVSVDTAPRPIPASGDRSLIQDFSAKSSASNPIAIIGMSGIFPGSPDLEAFWSNLEEGKDLISRAPRERWNFELGSGNAVSQISSMEAPWGGFISDVDKFDPLFFDISPREAELMDPQQRLFLQTVWHTLEDAGYKRSDLAGTKTGLFVGVAGNDYGNLLAMYGVPVEAYSSTGNSHSVLANRVSYFLDLRGPSEAIDTACSSSLVAIHRAIESLASGSSEMAIVGGVNLLLSPAAFLAFGKAGLLCADGRCKTFDQRADGYVRGEGVGAVFLKPLSRAERDGDHIYGVILGSAENHGGHVHSLTVPNPNAQAELLNDAYARAGIDPSTIGYIEAHGTGTSLGDPIEINGLKKAFAHNRGEVPQARCAVGSVKTNIGHLETAAGIAGVIKALLAIGHQRIPGNVHLQQVNPYIQVDGSPFYFPRQSEPWNSLRDRAGRELPRRAGISSFGFGGSNAHVVLEEYRRPAQIAGPRPQDNQIFIFSARDAARLHELVTRFVAYLDASEGTETLHPSRRLDQIAYTLQVGREPMDERLAIVASNLADLSSHLRRFLDGDHRNLFYANVAENQAGLRLLRQLHEDDLFLESLLERRQLSKLGALWVNGLQPDWGKLWAGVGIQRISLPGYVFECQRYWVPATRMPHEPAVVTEGRLHPLLHRNESTLQVQVYASQFSGQEPFLRDHQVHEQKVLPGAASLELALAGATLGLADQRVRLREVTWTRPIIASENGVALQLELLPENNGKTRFELRSLAGEIHVQGKAESDAVVSDEVLDLDAIRARCNHEVPAVELYAGFRARGLAYGPCFQVIQQIACGSGEAISTLELPEIWRNADYRLHPALVDGGFQTLAVLGQVNDGIEVPFAVDVVECREKLPRRCYAYGRVEAGDGAVRRYELKLLGQRGELLAGIGGFAVRRLERRDDESFFYRPVWARQPLLAGHSTSFAGTVLLFDDSAERAETWAARGISVVRIVPGETYERQANIISIRHQYPEDYLRLTQEVSFAGIIHCWSSARASLDEGLERGLFSVHYLAQALLKGGRTGRIVYVHPKDEPVYEAVSGYAKSLRQEQPKLRMKTVAVDDTAIDLLAELNDEQPEIRYIAKQREARTLEELSFGPIGDSVLRRGGVYIITGGAGGLGRIIAEHLVRKYDARLVLAGRSELSESKRAQLEELGPSVLYVRADVSTMDGASQAIRLAKERFGTINGIIHAAGILRDGLIWSKTLQDFEAVLKAKVRSLEVLDDLTRQEPLDCFILFSSTAGLFGNAGQSDYSFANAYLDGFAHRRARLCQAGLRSGRTISLDWPLWRDGGMRASINNKRAEALGLIPLDKLVGLQLFEQALSSGEVQIWCGVGDKEKIRQRLLERPPSEPGNLTLANVDAETKVPELQREITDYLVRRFAGLAKLDPHQIKTTEPLENYGLDSIMAVEFNQQLEEDFGALSKTLLFEYPTLTALAGYLLKHDAAQPAELAPEAKPNPVERVKASFAEFSPGPEPASLVRFSPSLSTGRRLALAPIDYAFVGPAGFPIQVLYYFERHLDFDVLRKALRQVADAFFPINSRLVRHGENEYLIQESSDDPDFREVHCLSQVVLPEQDREETFVPFQVFFDPLNPDEKLAKFRLFQMAAGSLLSANVSHAIADGYSFYYFLSSWAAACRGERFQVPDHSRDFLMGLVERYRTQPIGNGANGSVDLDREFPLVEAGIAATTSRIDTLRLDGGKLVAQAREAADEATRHRLSENGVLTAVVWQTYAQSLPTGTKELLLACPIDFRRLSRALSPSFFGNASAPALLRLDRSQILTESIASLAAMISDAIRGCDEHTLTRYCVAIDALRRDRGLAATNSARLVNPHTGLIVTNVARFPLPPIDFGTGPFSKEFTPVNYAGTAVIVGEDGPTVKVRLAYPEPIPQ
jgi:polyketide synthase PksN